MFLLFLFLLNLSVAKQVSVYYLLRPGSLSVLNFFLLLDSIFFLIRVEWSEILRSGAEPGVADISQPSQFLMLTILIE